MRLRNWQSVIAVSLAVIIVLAMSPISGFAATVTVKNNCSYTVYPGIYPATYDNGGWEMTAGSSVSFTLAAGWNGRIWGHIGCNSASPAVCETGSCGGGFADAPADDLSDFFNLSNSPIAFQAITPPSNTAQCISDPSAPGDPDDD